MKPFEKVIIIAAVVAGVAAIALVLTFTLSSGPAKAERALEAYRAPTAEEGLVTYVSGSVFVYREARWNPVEIGEFLKAGDYVKTFESSYCDIQVGKRVVFTVLENTAVKLDAVFHSAAGLKNETELLFGTILCKAQKLAGDETVRVRAGGTGFGVRGTEFLVERRNGRTVCAVKDGRLAVSAGEGVPETTVGGGQELAIEEKTGRPGTPEVLSNLRRALLNRLADLPFVDTDPAAEAGLVKVGIEVEPASAQIAVNGKPVGVGSYAGLFSAGTPIPVTLRKDGYQENSFTITPKRGDNRIYRFRLDLAAPEESVGAPEADEEYELRIKRLEDDARKAAAENEALKANVDSLKGSVDSLQKDKANLTRQLDEANRKIKDAMEKLK